jgi:DNA-binding transcriptional ArsR family regulator
MTDLDRTFAALADNTRRAMLEKLRSTESTISALAEPHAMTLSGALKHIRILEGAGLVQCEKRGREVWCRLNSKPLKRAASWIDRYETFWDEQLNALGAHLAKTKHGERR